MKFKLKEKKAPVWFKKSFKEMESNKKACADILGVGVHWLENKKRNSMLESDLMETFNVSKDEIIKFKLLVKVYNAMGDLMWAKFRLKNIGTDWARPGHIKYNPKKNLLILYKSPLDILTETFKKAFNQYAKTIEDK